MTVRSYLFSRTVRKSRGKAPSDFTLISPYEVRKRLRKSSAKMHTKGPESVAITEGL